VIASQDTTFSKDFFHRRLRKNIDSVSVI